MADKYIHEQEAIDIVVFECGEWTGLAKEISKQLKQLPAADVVQVRHGRWLPIVSYNNTYKCSECGRLLVNITDGLKMVAKNYPYCHCGAKMDGERKE